jgi:hypothetical protein
MKTYITLRSTLSNASWIQRGAAALLLMAALIITLTLALRPNTHIPASAPPVRQAAPAVLKPTMPVIGTGSAYNGGTYVTERPVVLKPTMPVIGTGSAYNGQ